MHIKIYSFYFLLVYLLAASFFDQVNAQTAVNYKFLEVVDFANKPVADATVTVDGNPAGEREEKTNQKGQLERGLIVYGGDYNTHGFTVSKFGYYTFTDILESFRLKQPIKIELLKIPQTPDEIKAVGNEQLKREFFLAVVRGQTDEVQRLLKAGVSPNLNSTDLRGVPGPKDVPAIVYATILGDLKTVKTLLDAGADITKNSPARDILLQFLHADPKLPPDTFFYRQQTAEERANPALFYEEGFDMLVKAGADGHIADSEGNTALTIAMYRGYVGIFKKLLAMGFSQKEKNETLRRLILNRDDKDPLSLEFMDLLIKSGADPNFVVEDVDNRRLRPGCTSLLMSAGDAGKLNFAKLLLANKTDINFVCENGNSALISAIQAGKPETVKMLFDAGISVYGSGDRNKTALIVAAELGNTEIVKLLLAKGFAVNARDEFEKTALMYATHSERAGAEQLIDSLLKAGADPNAIAGICMTAFEYPIFDGNLDIIRLLIAHGGDINLTCKSTNLARKSGETLLFNAVNSGRVKSVRVLIEAGADAKGEQGQRALEYAKEHLQEYRDKNSLEEIIKLLEAERAK